jgi:hypothetical protein
MAIIKETPTCPFCRKEIAKAVYKETSNENFVGDTFIKWEYEEHSCEEKRNG